MKILAVLIVLLAVIGCSVSPEDQAQADGYGTATNDIESCGAPATEQGEYSRQWLNEHLQVLERLGYSPQYRNHFTAGYQRAWERHFGMQRRRHQILNLNPHLP